MNSKQDIKVLFVCMGNICRSPTAEGVFRDLLAREGWEQRVFVDSAGTHAYHVGNPPDERAQETAARRGIDLSRQRARRVLDTDFVEFDYVLAMDSSNYEDLSRICPAGYEDRLRLFLEFAPDLGRKDVPDPYYGGASGFERVLDMIEAASSGLLESIRKDHR